MSGIAAKKHSLATLASIWVGLFFVMSGCNFTLASNATSASQVAPADIAESAPATAPTPTPNLPATIEAIVQRRLSELLAADSPSILEASQFPTLSPVNDSTGEHYRSGFACTGSMRPTIDCGDEGVFLKPPFPEPLRVGDIISFSSDVSCRYYKNQNISKAHRITSIRTESGIEYFTTKGDATNNSDACESTLSQIDGKLVEIRKGVRPQDVIDTAEYDLAKESVSDLKDQYEDQKAKFDLNKAAYDGRGEEYQALVNSYTDGEADYQLVVDFYQQLETERIDLNLAKDQLNDLAGQVNAGITEVDRLYQELFTQ